MFNPVRPFFDLLPSRINQALISRRLRSLRIKQQRAIPRRGEAIGTRGRLFVDLAAISRHDAGTGIQRVVRGLAIALMDEASPEWDIQFVAADRGRAYHVISWPRPGKIVDLTDIEGRPGDVFLGLDFSLDTVRLHRGQLAGFRRDGGRLWFLICDLLPAERPEWFSPNNVVRYKAWLEILAGLADGFLCISQQTEDDLRRVLARSYGLTDGYRTSVVPMGYDIKDSMIRAATAVGDVPMRVDSSLPFYLMVGTLEPRKGHADILAGFGELWRQQARNEGWEYRLVLIGRRGWHTETLHNAIRSHPEHGRKLIWLDDVEDPELERIYQACRGVIIGSHAEGFGLPLIEALGHNKPVLARDLPVFRTHEDLGVRYYPADADARVLAESIRLWTADVQAGRINVVRPSGGWKEAARTVSAAIA